MNKEHMPFDLEWAKHGGVLLCEEADALFKLVKFYCNAGCIDAGGEATTDCNHWVTVASVTEAYESGMNHDIYNRRLWGMRMATRAECEQAGVEYIEKPVSAEELEELRKDKEQLELMVFRYNGLLTAFHVNMLRAYPHKSHDEISKEINSSFLMYETDLTKELAELRKDSKRLDYMTKTEAQEETHYTRYIAYADGTYIVREITDFGFRLVRGSGKTQREAIDKAMKGGEL